MSPVLKQNAMNMLYEVIRSECYAIHTCKHCGTVVIVLTKYELTIDKVS